MTHPLTPHEQQQVDAAAKQFLYDNGWDWLPDSGDKNKTFKAGITFALDHLFAGRMERFAEWVRTFEALERQNGQWVIESQLSDKQIVKAFIEDLKQQQDGTNTGGN